MADKGKIQYAIGIDNSELLRDAEKSKNAFKGIADKAENEGGRIDNTFKNLAKGAAAFFTIQQASQLVQGLIKVRGEFQQLEIAFGTMLGNKAKADKLMSEMVALAAKTPFGLQDVASGAKQLLAYGFAAEDITKNITMLGNVASGVGSQVGDLIYLYGTLKASGRVTQMDINQFAGRGIPIYAELAKVMGVTVEKVRELVGEGKVGFPQIEKAFQGMTEQGGMFFNLMEAQSKSLTGQISNLQDNIAQMFNEIGQSSEGVLSKGIEGIAYLVENYKEIGNILQILVATYGTYRTALIVTAALEKARYLTTLQLGAANGAVTTSLALRTQWTNILAAAETRLAAAFSANPVGLAVTAIAGLVATYFVLRDTTTSLERAQKAYNDALKDVKDNTQDLSTKSREFLSIINDGSKTLLEQSNAYRDLKNLYNGRLADLDLESFKLKTVEERQRAVNVALSEYTLEGLKAQKVKALDTIAEHGRIEQTQWENFKETMRDVLTMEDSRAKRLEDAINLEEMLTGEISRQEEQVKIAAMTDAQRLEYAKKQLEPLEMQIRSLETTFGQLERNNDGIIKIGNNLAALSIQHVINQYNQWLGLINSANAAIAGGVANARTVAVIDKEISDLKDLQKGASQNKGSFSFATGKYTKGYADYDKEIKQKESERRRITGEVDKDAVASTKKAASASIKAQRSATQETNREYDRQTTLLVNKLNNEKSIYESFEKYKSALGIESAKERYKGLIDTSIGFETRLANEIAKLDEKKDKERLGKLIEMQTDAANKKFEAESNRQIEEYNKKLEEEEKHLADLLTKYATYEQQKKALREQYEKDIIKLSPGQQAERKRQYDEDLNALKNANSQKLVALSGYTQEALYMTKLAAKQQLEIFNKALSQKDLPADAKAALQKKANEIQEIINKPNRTFAVAQIDKEINKTQKALDAVVASGDTTSEVFKQLNDDLMRLKQQKADTEISKLSSALGRLSQLAPALQDLANALTESGDSGTWGEVASGIATVAAGASQLNQTFSDLKVNGASTGDAIVAGLQFALNLITTIISASKRRKAAAEDFYINVLGLQNDYNLALTEQIRLQAELGENVYLKDYFGRAKAGMEAAIAAASKYQKALNDLSKGRAKERQKNVVDGKTVGQLALSGAGAGAVIGTAIAGWAFGIGTVVGAVIGAAVGAIGGLFAKKKKDVYGGLLEQYPELLRKGADGQREINKELAEALLKNNQLDAVTQKLVQNALDQEKAYKAAYDQMRGVVADLSGSLGDDLRNALVNAWKAGEDSAKAFGDTVDKVLENILSNLLFHAAFNDLFDKLEKDLTNDFVYGGIGDITDSLGGFFKAAEGIIPVFNASMDAANQMAKEFGLNAFGQIGKTEQDKNKNKNSLSGAYAQASQESIDLLSGHSMGMKLAQLETNTHLKIISSISQEHLEHARNTAQNTGATVIELKTAIKELQSINNKMNNNANNALAAGL